MNITKVWSLPLFKLECSFIDNLLLLLLYVRTDYVWFMVSNRFSTLYINHLRTAIPHRTPKYLNTTPWSHNEDESSLFNYTYGFVAVTVFQMSFNWVVVYLLRMDFFKRFCLWKNLVRRRVRESKESAKVEPISKWNEMKNCIEFLYCKCSKVTKYWRVTSAA